MRKRIVLVLLAMAANASYAVGFGAEEHHCFVAGDTYVCPKAWTKVNAFEATFLHEVHVEADFNGPDYDAERVAGGAIILMFPSTWEAKVTYSRCAFSGPHSVSAAHSVIRDDPDLPPLPPIWQDTSFDLLVQFSCDCGGDPE